MFDYDDDDYEHDPTGCYMDYEDDDNMDDQDFWTRDFQIELTLWLVGR